MGRPNIRLMTDLSNGHGCFPPFLPAQASINVFVNGLAEVRSGDSYMVHCCPGMGCHKGMALPGSSTVFVNGRLAHTKGAGIECGDTAGNGSLNVFTG